jgi:hypothetical protein
LLDSDPSIRWQVMRDLTEEPDELVAAERSRVASEGWGARLLALQGPDGKWGDGTSAPEWESTLYALLLLRDMGLDPSSGQAREVVGLVRDEVTWGPEFGNAPFFEGEVEPCINGAVLALGGYFGEASDRLLDRLLGEQLEDGGWTAMPQRVGDPRFTPPSAFWKDCWSTRSPKVPPLRCSKPGSGRRSISWSAVCSDPSRPAR